MKVKDKEMKYMFTADPKEVARDVLHVSSNLQVVHK